MKKINAILLSLFCIFSLLVISGVVMYSFRLQEDADSKENSANRSPLGENTEDLNASTSGSTKEDTLDEVETNEISESDNTSAQTGSYDNDSTEPDSTQPPETASVVLPDTSVSSYQNGTTTLEPIILGFAGDINFDEDSKPVARYDAENKGILGGLSSELVEEMKAADLMMLNNEFAYSTRGVEASDKSYTFRADPKRVDILKEMGVDIVSLANNHALDFGMDALRDTFTTLEDAKINYVGAGTDLNRAKAPIYYTIGDKKIAYVAASKVVFAMDWYATDTSPGMIGTYDPTLFLASIKEASENSDYVVAYVHWGEERTNYPVEYQKDFARQYIDAGADIVIGCHPHVMQGLEFYKGKPIAYSLGNYWFNASNKESGLLKVIINPDDTLSVQLLPAMQENTFTYLISEKEDRDAYFKFMEEISFDVEFDENGFATEKTN